MWMLLLTYFTSLEKERNFNSKMVFEVRKSELGYRHYSHIKMNKNIRILTFDQIADLYLVRIVFTSGI